MKQDEKTFLERCRNAEKPEANNYYLVCFIIGDCGTRRGLGVNGSSPSIDGDHGAAAFTPRRQMTPLTYGSHEGNVGRSRKMRPTPIAAAKPSTDAKTRGRR